MDGPRVPTQGGTSSGTCGVSNIKLWDHEFFPQLFLVIEFLSTIPLLIHLCVQEILAWLDHWLNLVDYMNYLPKQAQNIAYSHGYLVGLTLGSTQMKHAHSLTIFNQVYTHEVGCSVLLSM